MAERSDGVEGLAWDAKRNGLENGGVLEEFRAEEGGCPCEGGSGRLVRCEVFAVSEDS